MKNKSLLVSAMILSAFGYAQTGPGGIGDQTQNSLWIDANTLSLANNDPVTIFDDVSGNGNDFEQLDATRKPTFETNAINGLPALSFDGTLDYMRSGSIPDLESSELSWFIVYKKNTPANTGLIGGSYTSNINQWLSYTINVNNLAINGHYSMGSLRYAGFNEPHGNFLFSSTHVTATNIRAYANGAFKSTRSATYTAPSGHQYVALGHIPGTTFQSLLDGYVAEAFVYNQTLNDLERTIVDNYLGAKYNIAIPNDYYSYEATHNIGVIGIGDDGVDQHTDSKGSGILQISAPDNLGANEYFFVGHTNTDLLPLINTDLPAAISATHERFNRTWVVDETGDVGNMTVSFDVSSIGQFSSTGTYHLLIDDDGNFVNATSVTGTYNAGAMTVDFSVNLSAGDYICLAGEPSSTEVFAIADGNWSNTATWSCTCVPSAAQNVTIDGFDVTLDQNGMVNNLTIEALSSLTWSASEDIEIAGDFDLSGDITMNTGSVTFNGSAVTQEFQVNGQNIEISNMTVDNQGGELDLLSGSFLLNGLLSPDAGTIDFSGTSFIINSTSASTLGRVGPVSPLANLSGNVTVRRFLPSGVAGNRNLASPVIGATLSEWDNDIEISGAGFPDGCAFGDTTATGCYFSVKTYFGSSFTDITDINHVLVNGQGYEVFLGDDLTTFSGATIESTGALNNNDVSVITSNGWNLVGNPYASPVLFSQASTSNNLEKYFYVMDAAAGAYQWYDKVSNTSSVPELANGLIASGQGIWVFNWGVLTFPQSSKSSGATFIRNTAVNTEINLKVKQQDETYFSMMSVAFDVAANDATDALDVKRFSTGLEKASSMYMAYDGEELTKNYLLDNGDDKRINLTFNSKAKSYYTLSIADLVSDEAYQYVYIVDKLANEVVNLKASEYVFYADQGEDADRFTLVLTNTVINKNDVTPATTVVSDVAGIGITQMANTLSLTTNESLKAPVALKLINTLGQEVVDLGQIDLSNGHKLLTLPNELSGVYIVVVNSERGTTSKKIVL